MDKQRAAKLTAKDCDGLITTGCKLIKTGSAGFKKSDKIHQFQITC